MSVLGINLSGRCWSFQTHVCRTFERAWYCEKEEACLTSLQNNWATSPPRAR